MNRRELLNHAGLVGVGLAGMALSPETLAHSAALANDVIIKCNPMKCKIREFPPKCTELTCTLTSPDCDDFKVPCDTVKIETPETPEGGLF